MPATDDAALGLVHDHAYWVSDLALNSEEPFPAKGTIDAFSHAFGVGDPVSTSGTATGAAPLPYEEFNRTWGEPPAIPAVNRIDITLTNLSSATVDVARAGIDVCELMTFAISSDSPARLLLAGAPRPLALSGAAYEVSPEGVTLVLNPGESIVSMMPDCLPDLEVSALTATKISNQAWTVRATVVNTGAAPAPATQTEILQDGAKIVALLSTPALGPGESAVVTASWDTRGLKNSHTLLATADDTNVAQESDESNNARSIVVNVR
jgi:hypothetical protein